MNPETPQTPSGAMLRYLSKQPHEVREILRLAELYKPRWKDRRKDSALAAADAEIIQLLRHRLSELARSAQDDANHSIQKLDLLRRNIEQEIKKRLALLKEKIEPIRKQLQALDELLKPTKAERKATRKTAKGSKRSAAAKRKSKAAPVAKKKKTRSARGKSKSARGSGSAGTPSGGAVNQAATQPVES